MEDKNGDLHNIRSQWEGILRKFNENAELQPGKIVVVGCSTSEILGKKIGSAGNKEVADLLMEPLLHWAGKLGIYLAIQCCEHLNRVLIVEMECKDKYCLEPVVVLPALKAGGALSVSAWDGFAKPVAVERIQAHAGLDIGDTFIGMHLKPVVVPVRIDVKKLGQACLNLAKTRPKYVGGSRAVYPY